MRSSAPPLVLLASPSAEVRSRWSQALQGAAVIQEVGKGAGESRFPLVLMPPGTFQAQL